jgi:hypothetical protein
MKAAVPWWRGAVATASALGTEVTGSNPARVKGFMGKYFFLETGLLLTINAFQMAFN